MNFSAYQGKGWRPRQDSLPFAHGWGVNSEFGALKVVLLYLPGLELEDIRGPTSVQFLRQVDARALRREIRNIAAAFRAVGVRVIYLRPHFQPVPPNLMFVRDLFFATPRGIVVGRMASEVRAGEEKFAVAELALHALSLRTVISGSATFEGADALWLNPTTVLIGTGNRTNAAGFKQVQGDLKLQGVRAVRVPLPRGVQHLLGLLQLVDRDLAVVRSHRAGPRVSGLLKRHGCEIIKVRESHEVLHLQAMNFVTIRPRQIIMAKNCPELKAQLSTHGIKVVKEVSVTQLSAAAGGLACATGILSRSPINAR